MYKIFNTDCVDVMNNQLGEKSIDIILTSPPYNNSRTTDDPEARERGRKRLDYRYDIHMDDMSNDEYIDKSIEWFNCFDRILKKDGCILYNISYGNENPSLMWQVIAEIINKTDFMVSDCIIWKKKSALPNNVSHNKLTRICEFVFVFCRKEEFNTFKCNKKITSKSITGQKIYENIFNFIEARNNDGLSELNKATYSTELCEKLLRIYAQPNSVVFDPFMGTGTTAVACQSLGFDCYGSEISEAQVKFAISRLQNNNDYKYIGAVNSDEKQVNLW